jgi:hypothetical protein
MTLSHSDGKEVKLSTRQMVNDVDEMKRLLSHNLISADYEPYPSFQGANCVRAFTNGSPHRTPRRITILHVALITRKQQPGFSKAASFRSGS